MESLSVTTLLDLHNLAFQHLVDFLNMRDVVNLCLTSRSLYRLLHNTYTLSLSFPLHNNYMVKDEPEKPVLAILTNGTTDQDCQANTNKQIAKLHIGKLKVLRLRCPNEEDEVCINLCSTYHQRILYNLYHKHWKRRTSFNLQSLSITISEKVCRLYQVVSAMPTLIEVDLHISITTNDQVALIREVCAHPSIRKFSVTILLQPDLHEKFTNLTLKSENLEDLTLKGASGLSITMMDLPKLKNFRFLPQSPEEVAELLAGANLTMRFGRFNMARRFELMHQQCPRLQFYNDTDIGDVIREDCRDWTTKIAERMFKDSC